jgi:hypothetical protein
MGEKQPPDDDVLLAVALAAAPPPDRQVLPDRRSGLDRRKEPMSVSKDRRSGEDRRRHTRREGETPPAGLLRRVRAKLPRPS